MKLKDGFITHESANEHITVTAGNTDFNGIIRSNMTAGFILECLKEEITKEAIVFKMLMKFDASKEQLEKDVDKVIKQLYQIGAIDD